VRHFIDRHADKITGVINGFDRIVFRGIIRGLCYPAGVGAVLRSQDVLLKHFGKFVESVTAMVRDGARHVADCRFRKLWHHPFRKLWHSSRPSSPRATRPYVA
jgi:hypothetical protein